MDRSRTWSLILLTTCVLVATGCASEKSSEDVFPQASEACENQAVKNRYIVQWESGEITYVEAESREKLKQEFVEPNLQALKRVENDFRIERTDTRVYDTVTPQFNEIDNWGVQVTEAPAAWAQGIRGQGMVVAVIDSGVDRTHPQLANAIYVNQGESGTDSRGRSKANNGVDDDANGFIDDYSGWDFVNETPDVYDDDSHGTHVSGIIAAQHNDTTLQTGYVQGMAPGAKIMPLDFITGPSGYVSDGIEAIKYAAKMHANIINASWGGPACSTILENTIAGLSDKNILFVAASGNDGLNIDVYQRFPASYDYPHQITVGMIGTTLMMASRSNYGDNSVYIFAPGMNIYSTIPGGSVAAYSGTSMATPSVVGAAALVWSARPSLHPSEIKGILGSSSDFSSAYRNQSRGRINVRKALTLLP